MKKFLIAFLFFVAIPVSAYYNPGQPSGFINDFANIIDDATEQQMESKLAQFEQETSNEISVVTIQSLSAQGGAGGEDYIENFAEKLFAEWGIGKSAQGGSAAGGKDNGVLILVALEDREMRIEVGYGLEGALTDAQSNWIINEVMKPAFQDERYGHGINQAVDKIMGATKGEYVPSDAPSSPQDSGGGWDYDFVFWIAIFGFLWLSSILGRSKSWWAGGVIGGAAGVIIGLIKGFVLFGIIALAVLIPFGLLFDFIISKNYAAAKSAGRRPPWWIGGGRSGSGGGFGGFGGGMSGGGGASGRW